MQDSKIMFLKLEVKNDIANDIFSYIVEFQFCV